MQVFAGHTGPVNCGEFTPDGEILILSCPPATCLVDRIREENYNSMRRGFANVLGPSITYTCVENI